MKNFVRAVRTALGMTQMAFSQAVGLSYQSIQSFERGTRPSDATLERLKTFAVERGLAHLVLEFFPAQVTRVFEPAPRGSGLDLHALLDEILQASDPTARLTTENFLFMATQYLRRPK